MKEQQEEKKEVIDEEEEPADIFIGKDIIESYNYFHHYTSTNSKQEYYRVAEQMKPEEIAPEINQMLDAIREVIC